MEIPYFESSAKCQICGGGGMIRGNQLGNDWLYPVVHVYREDCEYYLAKKRCELERKQKESSPS